MTAEPYYTSYEAVCSESIAQTHRTALAKPTHENPLANALIRALNSVLFPIFNFLYYMFIDDV